MNELDEILVAIAGVYHDVKRGMDGNRSASIRSRRTLNEINKQIVIVRKKLLDASKIG